MPLDRYACYEICAQNPRQVVAMLRSIHLDTLVLREDFCATAAIARRWAAEGRMRGDDARAVGADIDEVAIEKAREAVTSERLEQRVTLVHADAIHAPPDAFAPADIIFVGNFSINFVMTREDLLTYFRRSRERLAPRGMLTCEIYGGKSDWLRTATERTHYGPAGEDVHYRWECEEADPVSRMVTHSMSFRVVKGGAVIADLPRAFICRWRLWSMAELRQVMLEADFRTVDVYPITGDWPQPDPVPLTDEAAFPDDWVAMIVGR
jgi:hypothetical protein